MTHLETELDRLKEEVKEMGILVQHQLRKSIRSMILLDKDLAREVIFQERRVNAEELRIDRDCESIMALFNPVAIDLRLVFATFKINSHLERIGDNAKGIAKYALGLKNPYEEKLLNEIGFQKMATITDSMIEDNLRAFDQAETSAARNIFRRDVEIDEINRNATQVISTYIQNHNDDVIPSLNLISSVRKLERIGDLNKNIAEEIIFFVEANVLKHEKEKI